MLLLEVGLVMEVVRLLTAATEVESVGVLREPEEAGLLSFALAVAAYVSAGFEEPMETPDGFL